MVHLITHHLSNLSKAKFVVHLLYPPERGVSMRQSNHGRIVHLNHTHIGKILICSVLLETGTLSSYVC